MESLVKGMEMMKRVYRLRAKDERNLKDKLSEYDGGTKKERRRR